jgi:hypothetical protein
MRNADEASKLKAHASSSDASMRGELKHKTEKDKITA